MRTFTEWLTEAANHAAAAEYVVKAMNDPAAQRAVQQSLANLVMVGHQVTNPDADYLHAMMTLKGVLPQLKRNPAFVSYANDLETIIALDEKKFGLQQAAPGTQVRQP
jgi:acetate kinase